MKKTFFKKEVLKIVVVIGLLLIVYFGLLVLALRKDMKVMVDKVCRTYCENLSYKERLAKEELTDCYMECKNQYINKFSPNEYKVIVTGCVGNYTYGGNWLNDFLDWLFRR